MTRTGLSLLGVLLGGLALTTTAAAQSLPTFAPALQAPVPVQACERRSSGKELITAIIAQTGGAPQTGFSRASIAVDNYAAATEPLNAGFESEFACTICLADPGRPSSGSVSIDGQTHQIHLAQSMPRGSGRRVTIVLAPPPALPSGPRLPPALSVDGRFGVIILDVDSRGRGTGELITSAKLGLDASGFVEVQQSLAPIQLLAEVKVVN
jgi:hypothetical protein